MVHLIKSNLFNFTFVNLLTKCSINKYSHGYNIAVEIKGRKDPTKYFEYKVSKSVAFMTNVKDHYHPECIAGISRS